MKLGAPKPLRRAKRRGKYRPPRSRLIAEIDKLTSLIVRRRDGACVVCGRTEPLDAGHLIKRGKLAVRFNLRNVNAQCKSCNFKHNPYPEGYTRWFLHKYGQDEYDRLSDLAENGAKWGIPELTAIRDEYQRLWDNWPASYSEADLRRLGYYG